MKERKILPAFFPFILFCEVHSDLIVLIFWHLWEEESSAVFDFHE
jgi:hypothetical protein